MQSETSKGIDSCGFSQQGNNSMMIWSIRKHTHTQVTKKVLLLLSILTRRPPPPGQSSYEMLIDASPLRILSL